MMKDLLNNLIDFVIDFFPYKNGYFNPFHHFLIKSRISRLGVTIHAHQIKNIH